MDIEGFTVQEPDIHKAIDRVIEHYKNYSVVDPDLFVLFFSTDDIAVEMRSALTYAFPDSQLVGTSSAGGVFSSTYDTFDSPCAITVLAFYDHEGAYGVASNLIHDNASEIITYTIDQAIINSKRTGEIPRLVWFYCNDMDEVLAIQILETKFGKSVPICGGVPANIAMGSELFCQKFVYHNEPCFLVALFYPSCEVVINQANFFEPLPKYGIISRVSKHVIEEIDNSPAKAVYQDWLQDYLPIELLDGNRDNDTAILNSYPIGMRVGISSEGSLYQNYCIESYGRDGCLNMYNQPNIGDRVSLMQSLDREKIQLKFKETFEKFVSKKYNTLAVMSSMCKGLKPNFSEDAMSFLSNFNFPNVGFFANGEFGRLRNGHNISASLMLSCVAFCSNKDDS